MSRKSIFVCGAGHQGLAMASHLALNGNDVRLWNRTEKHIEQITKNKQIHCRGFINGEAKLTNASSNIADVITDFVMVTTPSSAHKDIAKEIAPFVHKDMVIVLNPGRTFGAIEFAEELKKYGITELPHIAETQSIVYTCRKINENSVSIFAMKDKVNIAALKKSDMDYIWTEMPDCLRNYFEVVDSVGQTSFANVGMILHCAPVLMNIGWIESQKVEFKYYYDGISPSIGNFLEKMDSERQRVAMEYGFRIESVKEWLKRSYHSQGDTLYECIRNTEAYKEIDAPSSLNTRYIYEDVPNGLVPIEKLAMEKRLDTPFISLIIDLASMIMKQDYREIGRQFSDAILKEYF